MPPWGPVLGAEGVKDVANYVMIALGRRRATAFASRAVKRRLRQDLLCLPRRGRQGQSGARRAEPDRQDLALRRRRADDHRDHHQRAQRPHAGVEGDADAGADPPRRRVRVFAVAPRRPAGGQVGARERRMARPSLNIVTQKADRQSVKPDQSAEQALYEIRKKIYPRAVRGWFAAWRWALVWATQLVFYGGAWLTWNGRQARAVRPRQRASSTSSAWRSGRRTSIYLTVLLVIAALSPVPVHGGRRPPVVRLRLPADGLHRDVHVDRAR